MAVSRGPKIVTDGLVFCIDAADRNSYSGAQNLVRNGFGFLGSNANFTGFTYDTTDYPGFSGSFKYTGGSNTLFSSDFITIDTNRSYSLTLYGKAGNTGGSGYYSQNNQYAGIACYDIDQNFIETFYFMKYSGATDTTLANALNTGATTITLTDGTGWATTGAETYQRQIMWWPYTNSQGYSYPDYTYSRNSSINNGYYSGNGCWSSRTGNVLTLTQAWPGPNLAAGTKVANGSAGGTYNYALLAANSVPNTWTQYSATIAGVDTSRVNDYSKFRPGTAYIRMMFLTNYTSSPVTPSDAIIRYADIMFKDTSGNNWKDMVSNYNGSLTVGGADYSANNAGAIQFLDFGGNGSTIDFGTLNLNLSSMTVEYWFQLKSPTDVAGGNEYRFMTVKDGNFFNFMEEAGYINFTMYKGAIDYRRIGDVSPGIFGHGLTPGGDFTGTKFSPGPWYHVVFTYESSSGKGYYYANGNLINSGLMRIASSPYTAITAGNMDNSTSRLYFSYTDQSSVPRYFPGNLAVLRVYNRSLNSSEVKQNFEAGKSRFRL